MRLNPISIEEEYLTRLSVQFLEFLREDESATFERSLEDNILRFKKMYPQAPLYRSEMN